MHFNLLGHNKDKIKIRKKANKAKAHYCMYCLQYKTVNICLKRTEIC